MIAISKRNFLALSFSGLVLGLMPSDALAKPPKTPNRGQSKGSSRRSPQPKKTTKPVKTTPKVKQLSKNNTRQGQAINKASASRPSAHPYLHKPMTNRQMRKNALNRLKQARKKQSSGQSLKPNEKARLRRGDVFSSFYKKDTMDHSVGYARKHYKRDFSNMKVGDSFSVKVPYNRPIGRIYSTKTGKYTEGKTSRVVFSKDRNGLFVKTQFVE